MSYLVIVLACFCSMVLGVPVGKRDVSLTWSGEPGDAGQPTPVGGYSQDTSMSMDTPEYVRSLFVNFTKETQSPTHFVQYNTIRSFENVAKEQNCQDNRYTVKFNMSAIRKTELLYKSTLRVRLALAEGISLQDGTMDISLLFLNNTVINSATISMSSSEWIEFGVTPAVNWWMRNGGLHDNQGFKIELQQTGLTTCNPNLQVLTSNSGEFLPLLTVFTHETDASQSALSQTVAKMLEQVTEDPQAQDAIKLSKRDATTCSKTTASISTAWLNDNILKYDDTFKRILYPESLNINKCNGQCDKKPTFSDHSSLLYLLKFGKHEDFVDDNHVLTCVPVDHTAITVVMHKANEYVMESIGRAVKQCGCVYTPSQPQNCS